MDIKNLIRIISLGAQLVRDAHLITGKLISLWGRKEPCTEFLEEVKEEAKKTREVLRRGRVR